MTTSRGPQSPSSVWALAVTVALVLGGCSDGGSADTDLTPAEVLAEAKTRLDDTSGVRVSLGTERLPDGVDGIVSAEGVGTHPPAFEGDLSVVTGGIPANAAVVAVGGKVYAKLPFTTEFDEIVPAAYSAPDPARLMSPDGGLSSLLTEAVDVEEGSRVRSGESVLTEYTAAVPGEAVAAIIPSASTESSFDATFTISDDNLLDEAVLVGAFYPDAPEVTYTVAFDDYGAKKEITAP